jgi:hypothetical protein
MNDMSKRLGEMGFEPVATRWVTAWDVSKKPAAAANDPAAQGAGAK